MPRKEQTEISIVLPCYNEADNVDPMLDRLREVLAGVGRSWEILYVDDASTDATADRVRAWFDRMPGLRLLRHAKNSGQSAALWTGFRNARGEVIVTLDGDLQNDPADIPELLDRLENCDMVCGARVSRRDTGWKRFSSRLANWYRRKMLGDPFQDTGCNFRAFRREVLLVVPPFQGLHRFLPSICLMNGYRVKEIPVRHHPRRRGVSKYGTANRLWVGLQDTFAMRWYRKRRLPTTRVEEERHPGVISAERKEK
jgi:glycosyltransferase involved in cell wall biosynthesis